MSSVSMSHSDIISLCRLCLAKDLASIDIFETGSEIRQLFTKIVACLPVQVMRDDSLPTKICEVCNSKVDDFYNFWSSTAKNQKQLNDWLSTATDEDPKTDQPTIKIEADDTRQDTDYENDYDDGGGDHDDSDYDAPNAKRIKINASDVEEDLKPEVDTILSEDLNGDQTPSTSTSKRKKSKDQKSKESDDVVAIQNLSVEAIISPEEWAELKRNNVRTCPKCNKQLADTKGLRRHLLRSHLPSNLRIKCEYCAKVFNSVHKINSHVNYVHVGVRPNLTLMECDYCGAKYKNKVLLRDHICSHFGWKLHTCHLCGKDYSSQKCMKRHLARHANESEKNRVNKRSVFNPNVEGMTAQEWKDLLKSKTSTCPKCGKEFSNGRYMRKHLHDIHPAIKDHICDVCGKNYKSSSSLREHKKFMHSEHRLKRQETKFVCTICGFACATKYTLRDHTNIHTGTKHTCETCGNGFASYKHLKRHRLKHMKEEGTLPDRLIYRCSQCTMEFTERFQLKRHEEWVHGDKCHLCKICGARIKGTLKQHMITHTGERPVCCHICGKKMRGKLKEHMLVHTGERPYACEVCGGTFKDKWYLRIHMRKHSGERPYVCEFAECGQSFAARSAYTLHLKKHEPPRETSLECEICLTQWPSKHLLKLHVKEHFL